MSIDENTVVVTPHRQTMAGIKLICESHKVTVSEVLVSGPLRYLKQRKARAAVIQHLYSEHRWALLRIARFMKIDRDTVRYYLTGGTRRRKHPRNCVNCGKAFLAIKYGESAMQQFCSTSCSNQFRFKSRR